jgi:hypothetical protein
MGVIMVAGGRDFLDLVRFVEGNCLKSVGFGEYMEEIVMTLLMQKPGSL